jgi:hypothetical protein
MEFVHKWPSRMHKQWDFSKLGGRAKTFRSGPKNLDFLDRWLPPPEYSSPRKVHVGGGDLTSSPTHMLSKFEVIKIGSENQHP